jgi:transcriptional regulator with XRE-family HTH domain
MESTTTTRGSARSIAKSARRRSVLLRNSPFRHRRLYLGFSQLEVSAASGVGTRKISLYESGKRLSESEERALDQALDRLAAEVLADDAERLLSFPASRLRTLRIALVRAEKALSGPFSVEASLAIDQALVDLEAALGAAEAEAREIR